MASRIAYHTGSQYSQLSAFHEILFLKLLNGIFDQLIGRICAAGPYGSYAPTEAASDVQ